MTFQKVGGDEVDRPLPKGWVAIPGTIILKETNQKKYNTRDQIDERLETEQVHHLGRITHEVTFSSILISYTHTYIYI